MAADEIGPDDVLPLDAAELESIEVRAQVALANPPGTVAPDPRPRRDALEEAYDSVLRLVREVRRLRRRDERAREALRTALASGDADAVRRVAGDVLDDSV
jgi:hypothetical protein